jgi:hypothetical protein
MPIVRLEHLVSDFDAWTRLIDRDPIFRDQPGVHHYRVLRPVGEPSCVIVELELDSMFHAENLRVALRDWCARAEAAGLVTGTQARMLDIVSAPQRSFAPPPQPTSLSRPSRWRATRGSSGA